ncbi:UNVERIFIED_CONTAM: hypothetical protein Slati_4231600 [Sesamum latifolium]|uniref:Retroviral polymerase SH3-like domain-containing protein n=1 Tax=Sesamum latifolium TaxID=2727402 RepID=A0AAW2TBK3_9LAMI
MMCACFAKKMGIRRGSVHNSSRTQVLKRSRKLSKDEMILRLGDGKAVAAEAVGSLRLVVSNHIRIDLKDCYFVPMDSSWNATTQRRNRTLLDMVLSMMSFTELPPSFWGYALETAAKLLNIAPSKSVPQTPYEVWHGKPASYKYLRVWGSPAYVKRLVEDKLDSRSSLCRFIRYSKEIAVYYFYDPVEQKIFISRNAVFLKKDFPSDNRCDEVLIEESSGELHHDKTTSFEPTIHTDGVPVLCRLTRESRIPERYGFVGLTSQLDNDPKTYGEAMSNINSDKWLEAMKSKMDSMGSNQV